MLGRDPEPGEKGRGLHKDDWAAAGIAAFLLTPIAFPMVLAYAGYKNNKNAAKFGFNKKEHHHHMHRLFQHHSSPQNGNPKADHTRRFMK